MTSLLIIYGTTEGQTRKIAGRMAEMAREFGHEADMADATEVDEAADRFPDLRAADAVVIAASVHQGVYQSAVLHFIKTHWALLASKSTAFVSVSLAAAGEDEEDRLDAQSYIDKMVGETGWQPDRTLSVAGAFRYTEYDFLKRWVLKMIASHKGAPTDTSRDWEFTDWAALDRFIGDFLAEHEARDAVAAGMGNWSPSDPPFF